MKQILFNTFIGAGIAIAALIGFVWIFGSQADLRTEAPKFPSQQLVESLQKPIGLPENTPDITGDMTKAVAQEIIKRNPTGPLTAGGATQINALKPEEAVEQMLTEGLKNFDSTKIRPTITASELIILPDASTELSLSYFRKFYELFEKNFKGVLITETSGRLVLAPVVAAYDQASKDFLALPVPKNLVSYHRREVELLVAQKNAFALMNNYEQDPVQAILAAKLGDALTQESVALIKELGVYVEKNNLKL